VSIRQEEKKESYARSFLCRKLDGRSSKDRYKKKIRWLKRLREDDGLE
jgi:hypothetical protein